MLQIPFSFHFESDRNPENFIVGECNQEAWNMINDTCWPFPMVLLTGDYGCGKSYLLSIWAKKTNASDLDNLVTPTKKGFYAVDDLDRFSEEELFHFYNACIEKECTVLFACRTLKSSLPDWASRLYGLPRFIIRTPSDDVLGAFILKFCYERGIQLSPDILKCMLYMIPRSFSIVSSFLLFLDHYLFREKCAMNRVTLKRVFQKFKTISSKSANPFSRYRCFSDHKYC